jgi:hypothetical protein
MERKIIDHLDNPKARKLTLKHFWPGGLAVTQGLDAVLKSTKRRPEDWIQEGLKGLIRCWNLLEEIRRNANKVHPESDNRVVLLSRTGDEHQVTGSVHPVLFNEKTLESALPGMKTSFGILGFFR